MNAPTDDEREALSNFLFTIYEHGSQPNALREADAILSFLAGFRRTEVPEPTAEKLRALGGREGDKLCPECHGELTSWFCEPCGNKGIVAQGEPSGAQVEAGAREAFFTDDAGGHIRGGHTWDTIPEVGRENYRTMVRAVLHAALRAAGGVR